MGVFDFFKQFSSKKEEMNELKLEEFDVWLDSWSKRAVNGADLVRVKRRISEEKKRIWENIQRLKQAELVNPNIPERAKQVMEGNRKAYVQKVERLLEGIDMPENSGEVLEFCDSFDRTLDYFAKTTIRNHYVLQEFFGNESGAISANIRNLDGLMKNVKRMVENSGVEKVNELRDKVREVEQKTKQRDEIKEKIKLAEKDLREESEAIKEKESKIKELEQGSKYRKFMAVVDKKKELVQEMKDLEKRPFHSFSVINAALKKYERMTLQEKLVGKYLDNPLKALRGDNELKIVEIAGEMRSVIISGDINLKERKKDKILRELDKFDRDYFEIFLSRHNELNKRLDELKSETEEAGVVREIEDLKQELSRSLLQLKGEKQKVEEMQRDMERIDIDEMKRELEEEILESIGEKVRIIGN